MILKMYIKKKTKIKPSQAVLSDKYLKHRDMFHIHTKAVLQFFPIIL